MQVAFGHHDDFRWDSDPQKSKIHINDAFPLRGLRYPAIVVTVTGGPALLRGIGDEFSTESGSEASIEGACFTQCESVTFSGNLQLSVALDIFARSSLERSEIADWCLLFMRHYSIEKFRKEGVLIKNITMGTQSAQPLHSDMVYRTQLIVETFSSWERTVPSSAQETLNAICLTGIFTSLPNGVTLTESFE